MINSTLLLLPLLHFLRLVPPFLASLAPVPRQVVPSPTGQNLSSLEGSAETIEWMNVDLGSVASVSLLLGWSFSLAARASLRRLETRVGAGWFSMLACWEGGRGGERYGVSRGGREARNEERNEE